MEGRQTAELVDRIRLQRHRLARELGVVEFYDSAVNQARRHPVAWILGGAVVGAVSARLLMPSLFRLSRGVARHWLHSTVQRTVLGVVHGVVWSLWPRTPSEVDGEWEDAAPDETSAPLQASGGAIQPLRSS